jgi:hypothetical protein
MTTKDILGDNVLLHLHVPKTGGQTFGMRFASAFPSDQVYYMEGDLVAGRDEANLSRLVASKSFISAHVLGPILHENLGWKTICLFRDPVERLVSSYKHARREPKHILFDFLNSMSFAKALELMPEEYNNRQARYLVESFCRCTPQDSLKGIERWLCANLHASLERIDWVAPLEDMDHFSDLLAMELGLHCVDSEQQVNQDPAQNLERDGEMKDHVRRRCPQLIALDEIVHQEAVRRFSQYRQKVTATFRAQSNTLGSDHVLVDGERHIRLRSGWYPARFVAGWGLEYRAGPANCSSFEYSRRAADEFIVFDVAFVSGITWDDIRAFDADTHEELELTKEGDNGAKTFLIRLSNAKRSGAIVIWVPEVWANCIFSKDYSDLSRVPYSTGNWRFKERQNQSESSAIQ